MLHVPKYGSYGLGGGRSTNLHQKWILLLLVLISYLEVSEYIPSLQTPYVFDTLIAEQASARNAPTLIGIVIRCHVSLPNQISNCFVTTNSLIHNSGEELIMEKIFYTVTEAGEALGLGRTKIYELMERGEIESVKIGTSRRISKIALEDFAKNISAVS